VKLLPITNIKNKKEKTVTSVRSISTTLELSVELSWSPGVFFWHNDKIIS
jgi:hypothetical protein